MICEVVLIDLIPLILIGEVFLSKFAYKQGLLILLNGFFSYPDHDDSFAIVVEL